MTDFVPFVLDRDLLLETTATLGACGDALGDLLADVHARVVDLHVTWSGLAAEAQRAAQAEWESGLADVQDGLRLLRAAGESAEEGHSVAVEANVSMWEQLR